MKRRRVKQLLASSFSIVLAMGLMPAIALAATGGQADNAMRLTSVGAAFTTQSINGSFSIANCKMQLVNKVNGSSYDTFADASVIDVEVWENPTENDNRLEYGKDYNWHFETPAGERIVEPPTADGVYVVAVEGIGDYSGTYRIPFMRAENGGNPMSVFTCHVGTRDEHYGSDDPKNTQVYTGSAITPPAYVFRANADGAVTEELTNGTDYDVFYLNNVNAGTGTLVAVGKGNYCGMGTCEYRINPLDISNATVTLSASSFTYNGDVQRPTVTSVAICGNVLPTSDYKVSMTTSHSAKTHEVTVKANSDNVTGTAKAPYKIEPLDISNATVSLSASSFTYNGEVQQPKVTSVAIGDKALPTSDYTVLMSKSSSAGTYEVKVKENSRNVTGTAKAAYKIDPLDIKNATVTLSASSFTYNGEVQQPKVKSVTVGGMALWTSEYTVSMYRSSMAGTYEVEVKAEGGNYIGTATAAYKINPLDISKAKVKLSKTKFTYNGKKKKPMVSSVQVGNVVVPSSNYKATYPSSIKAGSYKVTITGRTSCTGKVTARYSIAKAKNKLKVFTNLSKLNASAKTLTKFTADQVFKVIKNTSNGKITYKKISGNKNITVSKSGVVKVNAGLTAGKNYPVCVNATSKATTNYKSASMKVKLIIVVK